MSLDKQRRLLGAVKVSFTVSGYHSRPRPTKGLEKGKGNLCPTSDSQSEAKDEQNKEAGRDASFLHMS